MRYPLLAALPLLCFVSASTAFTEDSGTQGSAVIGSVETVQSESSEKKDYHLNETIKTAAGETKKITIRDQSELTLGPTTTATVTKFSDDSKDRQAEVNVEEGLVHAAIAKKLYNRKQPFIVRTKSATMGVRGTEFIVDQTKQGSTTLYTLDGAVAFGKTPEDLNNPSKGYLVRAGKSSSMELSSERPEKPKIFNKKTLYELMSNQAPGIMKTVEHHENLRKEESRKGENHSVREKHEWKRPHHRRQKGHP